MMIKITGMHVLIILLLGMALWGCVDGIANTDNGGTANIDNDGTDNDDTDGTVATTPTLIGTWLSTDNSILVIAETRISGMIGSLRVACDYQETAVMITLSNCDDSGPFTITDGLPIAYTIVDGALTVTVSGEVFAYTRQNNDDDGNSGNEELVGMWGAVDGTTLTFTQELVTGMLGTISISCNYSTNAMAVTVSNCDDIPDIPIPISGLMVRYTLVGDVLTIMFLGEKREYTRQ